MAEKSSSENEQTCSSSQTSLFLFTDGSLSGLMEVLNGVQGSYKEWELSGSLLHGTLQGFLKGTLCQ